MFLLQLKNLLFSIRLSLNTVEYFPIFSTNYICMSLMLAKRPSLLESLKIIIITNHATLSLSCFSLVYFLVYKEAEIVAQRLQ